MIIPVLSRAGLYLASQAPQMHTGTPQAVFWHCHARRQNEDSGVLCTILYDEWRDSGDECNERKPNGLLLLQSNSSSAYECIIIWAWCAFHGMRLMPRMMTNSNGAHIAPLERGSARSASSGLTLVVSAPMSARFASPLDSDSQ